MLTRSGSKYLGLFKHVLKLSFLEKDAILLRIVICGCNFIKIFIFSKIHIFSLCSNICSGWVLMDLKVLPSNFLELGEYFEYLHWSHISHIHGDMVNISWIVGQVKVRGRWELKYTTTVNVNPQKDWLLRNQKQDICESCTSKSCILRTPFRVDQNIDHIVKKSKTPS